MDGRTDGRIVDGWMHGLMDGWLDGRNGRMAGWPAGRTNRQTERLIDQRDWQEACASYPNGARSSFASDINCHVSLQVHILVFRQAPPSATATNHKSIDSTSFTNQFHNRKLVSSASNRPPFSSLPFAQLAPCTWPWRSPGCPWTPTATSPLAPANPSG